MTGRSPLQILATVGLALLLKAVIGPTLAMAQPPCDCPLTDLVIEYPRDDEDCPNCQHGLVFPSYWTERFDCVASVRWFLDSHPVGDYFYPHSPGPHTIRLEATNPCGVATTVSKQFHVDQAQALVVRGFAGLKAGVPGTYSYKSALWMSLIHSAAMNGLASRGWATVGLTEPTIETFQSTVENMKCLQAVYINAHGARSPSSGTYFMQFAPGPFVTTGLVPSEAVWGSIGAGTGCTFSQLRHVTVIVCSQKRAHILDGLGPQQNLETLTGPSHTMGGCCGGWGRSRGLTEWFAVSGGHGLPTNTEVDIPPWTPQPGGQPQRALSIAHQPNQHATGIMSGCAPENPDVWFDLDAIDLDDDPYEQRMGAEPMLALAGGVAQVSGCDGSWDLRVYSEQAPDVSFEARIGDYRNLPDGLAIGANWNMIVLNLNEGGALMDSLVFDYRFDPVELQRLGFQESDLVGVAVRMNEDGVPPVEPPGVLLPVRLVSPAGTARITVPSGFGGDASSNLSGEIVVTIAPVPLQVVGAGPPTGFSRSTPVSLSAPRPSPSVGICRFTLRADSADEVIVDVFSVEGRRVRMLGRESGLDASRDWTWDLCDDQGRRVSAGIYFLQARAHDGVARSKVVILN